MDTRSWAAEATSSSCLAELSCVLVVATGAVECGWVWRDHMDDGVDQYTWQFDVGSEGTPASRENVEKERRVNCTQQFADGLFHQLLEPHGSNLHKNIPWNELMPSWSEDLTDEDLSDPPPVYTSTKVNNSTPTPQPSNASGNARKASSPLLKRPRLRAPKGDPTKRHKCPVDGCTYSANGTGHLYRHMLTHNGRKDHKVSGSISLSTSSLHDFAVVTNLLCSFASSAHGPVATTRATKQHTCGHT